MNGSDPAKLITRCIKGEPAAHAHLYDEYRLIVHRAAARKLNQLSHATPLRTEVDDICNEVFARLYADDCSLLRKLHQPRSIRAWLTTLAANHTSDYVRRWTSRMRANTGAVREQKEEEYAPSPDIAAMATERSEALGKMLDQLDAGDKLILELFFMEDLKYTEIADMLDLNINTASSRLRRAKLKLMEIIKAEHHGLEP